MLYTSVKDEILPLFIHGRVSKELSIRIFFSGMTARTLPRNGMAEMVVRVTESFAPGKPYELRPTDPDIRSALSFPANVTASRICAPDTSS